jgi:DNA-3-methyladenine glycosylase II
MAPQRRSARISAKAETVVLEKPVVSGAGVKKSQSSVKRVGKKKVEKIKETVTKAVAAAAASADSTYKIPSTPKRKRASTKPDNVAGPAFPPITPQKKNKGDAATEPDLNRPVDPHHSTATLATPHGSRITAYPSNAEQASPSKTGIPRPTATTGNILQLGLAHLVKVEPRLRHVIEKHPSPPWGPADLAEVIDPFRSLTSGIIGQQVSGAAAKSIKNKFIALFNKGKPTGDKDEYDYNDTNNPHFPTPEEVAKCDITTLRTAGLSQRKAEYIQGLAEKFASGELSAKMLLTASDEEVLEKLIAVRGLGQWSVEMFSCFGLKRLDVFSTGDLGVQYVFFPHIRPYDMADMVVPG